MSRLLDRMEFMSPILIWSWSKAGEKAMYVLVLNFILDCNSLHKNCVCKLLKFYLVYVHSSFPFISPQLSLLKRI